MGEGRTQNAAADTHQYGGEHRDDVDRHQVFGSEFGFEQPEVVFVLETVKGGVEQVGGEGGRHAAEEHLPGELILPEGRHLLHGEQEAAHGSAKS